MKLAEEDLKKLVSEVRYFRVEGTTTTIAALLLADGFCLVGSSACISEADFDEEVGREIAYQNAFEKLWELEGYVARRRRAA